ncbi:NAD(P)/FAD-dependent oxidoreductase [Primorskyibacter sedentarius]|uniref:NAD(P)/FAD-dependent oxidoreductase n=1 Tax=Primorskyibacter sedentarius TaxID=745311 RepID=UPI001FB2A7D8|nr:FAD-binding oxidoreductase [Primorskyibacter sedentarius]
MSPDSSLPSAVDVVVIGGGIIGAATAMELASEGVSVALCEKGEIGCEQSSRNWGWVRLSQRDPREIPLMIDAIKRWEGIDQRLGRKTGFVQSGLLFTARNARRMAAYEAFAERLKEHQIDCRMVVGREMDDVIPGHAMKLAGGLLTPFDGRAEPQLAAPAIAEGARDEGAKLFTRCAVRSVETSAGRVSGVVTERGRIASSSVVLAGGAWSRLFVGNAGVALPQLKVLNSVLRTTPIANGPEQGIWADGFSLRKRADGGYTVSGGSENLHHITPDSFRLARQFLPALRAEWSSMRLRLGGRWREEAALPRHWAGNERSPLEQNRMLDPAPDDRSLQRALASARAAFPVMADCEVVQSWAGMIDVTPDAIPVISEVEKLPGLFISTGYSGHGFGISLGAGRLTADLVTGATPIVDPAPFRLSRFFDGSPITLDSGF